MADKKPAPKPPSSAEGQMIFVALIAVLILFVVVPTVIQFFGFKTTDVVPQDAGQQVSHAFDSFVEGISFISVFVAFVIILLIFYAKIQYKEITSAYSELLKNKEAVLQRGGKSAHLETSGIVIPQSGIQLPGSGDTNPTHVVPATPDPRWLEVLRHMDSHNQSDWRVAILEADILLFDMLQQMGYTGDSIGEMLKQVDPVHFTTLDEAWRAHKIRNTIAHQGGGYELTHGEAESAIRMYQRVFDEFYFV